MAAYKLTAVAEDHLTLIHEYGLDLWGEKAADGYYNALFTRFEQIAERPNSYPAVDHVRKGYRRSVYGVHSIYYRVADDDTTVEIIAILRSQDADETL
jgi:toxin ParE1/3/4